MIPMRNIVFGKKIWYSVFFLLFFAAFAVAELKRIGAFGCFDDCFNFGAGYFLLQGKQLYSQIFFNHQPFMAYISAAVQYIAHPQTLFELVKFHRLFVMTVGAVFGVGMIMRFGLIAFIPLLMYESTKFYIFGDRFLAEGIIVYPMMYLTALIWKKSIGEQVYKWEYIAAIFLSWFIFWMREPFIPWSFAAIILLWAYSWKEKKIKKYLCGIGMVFLILHVVTLLLFPFQDLFFNVITVNMQYQIGQQAWNIQTIAQIVFYPLFVLGAGTGRLFQTGLFIFSILFYIGFAYEIFKKKRYKEAILVVVLLSFANIRVVPVGTVFYAAFHMVPWYGSFLIMTLFFIFDMWDEMKSRIVVVFSTFMVACVFLFNMIAPQSFIREKNDTQIEFTDNYAGYFSKGQVIKTLAVKGDTMFVEMWEDPIYITAGVPTAYPYSWYTSVMPFFEKYRNARSEMFLSSFPTFYIGACRVGETDSFMLEETMKKKYIQLLFSGKPSCIYISKTVLPRITTNMFDTIQKYGYAFPSMHSYE